MKKHAWWIILAVIIVAAILLLRSPTTSVEQKKPLIGEDAAAKTQVAENTRSTTTELAKNIVCDLKTQNVAFDLYNPTDQELVINPKFRLVENKLIFKWNSALAGDLQDPLKVCGSEKIGPKQTLHCEGWFGIIQAAEKLEATGSAPRPNELAVFTPTGSQYAKVFCN